MANPQEHQPFNISHTTPPSIITEHEQAANEISDNYYNDDEDVFSGTGCGCFRLFPFLDNRRHLDGESPAFLRHRSGDIVDKDSWWMNRIKSLKEASEVMAGPKWKNFIRKFSRKQRKGNLPFQYDPESYALNFNDGGGDDGGDDLLPRSFSTRFVHSRSMAN